MNKMRKMLQRKFLVFINSILSIFILLGLSTGCEIKSTPVEVTNCLKNFAKMKPEACLLRTSVGEYKMEFPLIYAPSISQLKSDDDILVRLQYPADKRLSKYIKTTNVSADFLPTRSTSFNGRKIKKIILSNAKLGGLKNVMHFSFEKNRALTPLVKRWLGEDLKSISNIQKCLDGPPFERGRFKLKRKEFGTRMVRISYSGRIGDVCSLRLYLHIKDEVILEVLVHFPVILEGVSKVNWREPVDWGSFFSSLEEFITSITFEENNQK